MTFSLPLRPRASSEIQLVTGQIRIVKDVPVADIGDVGLDGGGVGVGAHFVADVVPFILFDHQLALSPIDDIPFEIGGGVFFLFRAGVLLQTTHGKDVVTYGQIFGVVDVEGAVFGVINNIVFD